MLKAALREGLEVAGLKDSVLYNTEAVRVLDEPQPGGCVRVSYRTTGQNMKLPSGLLEPGS